MKWWPYFVIIIFTLIFTQPFFKPGYFSTDDGQWAIVRLAEIGREFHDGQIPPRWSDFLNHGYGYPLFYFTYPLPYYLGYGLNLIRLDLTDSIKFLSIISVGLSGVGMYLLAKNYWGVWGGLFSSLMYIMMPYRLVNLYIRGSLGENVALAVAPFVFLFTHNYLRKKTDNWQFASVFLALLVLSHNVAGLLILFWWLLFIITGFPKTKDTYIKNGKILLLGLVLAAFFWIPAFLDKKYILAGNMDIADRTLHFLSLKEIFGQNTNYSVKPPLFIGFGHLFSLLLATFSFVIYRKNASFAKGVLLVLFISVFGLLPASSIFWKLPLLSSIDFPWRLFLLISLLIPWLIGNIVNLPRGKQIIILLLILCLVNYLPLVKTKDSFVRQDSYYDTLDATTTSNNELSPIWVLDKPGYLPGKKVDFPGEVKNLFYNSKNIEFLTNSPVNALITINSLYFPGWVYRIDNRKINISPSYPKGLVNFSVPAGQHKIQGKLIGTSTVLLGNLITVAGLSYLLFTGLKKIRSRFQ